MGRACAVRFCFVVENLERGAPRITSLVHGRKRCPRKAHSAQHTGQGTRSQRSQQRLGTPPRTLTSKAYLRAGAGSGYRPLPACIAGLCPLVTR